jgi:hypothetical protein
VLDASEAADDRRQRRRDDGLVGRREQRDEKQRGEDETDPRLPLLAHCRNGDRLASRHRA